MTAVRQTFGSEVLDQRVIRPGEHADGLTCAANCASRSAKEGFGAMRICSKHADAGLYRTLPRHVHQLKGCCREMLPGGAKAVPLKPHTR